MVLRASRRHLAVAWIGWTESMASRVLSRPRRSANDFGAVGMMPQLSRPSLVLQPPSMFLIDKTEQKKQARRSDPTSPITSKFADQMLRKVIVVVSIVKMFLPAHKT